jgi:hypothetical protein
VSPLLQICGWEVKHWEYPQISREYDFAFIVVPLILLSVIAQIFPVTDRVYVGLPGLATDVTTL